MGYGSQLYICFFSIQPFIYCLRVVVVGLEMSEMPKLFFYFSQSAQIFYKEQKWELIHKSDITIFFQETVCFTYRVTYKG